MTLKKGTRVVVNDAYIRQFPRSHGMQGIVTGYPRKGADACVCVRFEGHVCTHTVAKKYLDVVTR